MIRKTVLVTGGYGFIASHLVRHIFERYNRVINVDKMDEVASEINVPTEIRQSPRYFFEECDITNFESVENIFSRHKIDIVFHLAAQSHVDKSYTDPRNTLLNNVLGTMVLLDASRRHKVEKFLHMSTDEVYGDVVESAATEDHPLNPTNPYAASKASAEHYVKMMFYSYNLPVVLVRCNNIYGHNQYTEKVLPTFVRRLVENKNIEIHDGGNQKRSWLHVDDACRAIILACEKGEDGEVYNIDSKDEYDITFISKKVGEILGKKIEIEHTYNRPYNDSRYFINGDKLRALGWEQQIPFEVGIKDTIEHFIKKFSEGRCYK
jgi:dTDP-glucose 4,6-dehydratase